MLYQACREVLVQVASTSLDKFRLIRWGREVTGALPSGTEVSKGIQEQGPKSVLDFDITSTKSQRASPSCSLANEVKSGP